MTSKKNSLVTLLMKKGVRIPCPESVEIGAEVDPERISGEGTTIHTGCKIYGHKTLMMHGVELGGEAPVTVNNCQLGRNVKLAGGFHQDSCYLEGASMGSGAQVRQACLLEEGARGAHCVGLKHTILLPFVTLGSLINFCDCLMSGGTGEKNHSEVGSSYIHFNYTPNQDKATASLIGDVPKGVMLNQSPIFLGGQGGIVGPIKVGYGIVVGAGNIVRNNLLEENMILIGQASPTLIMPFSRGLYTNIKRIFTLNIEYIANLIALRRWHLDIRPMFLKDGFMEQALLKGAVEKLDMAIKERINKLHGVANNMPQSISLLKDQKRGQSHVATLQQEFFDKWPEIEQGIQDNLDIEGDPSSRDAFQKTIGKTIHTQGKNYLSVIKILTDAEAEVGTTWLQGIVDQITRSVLNILPSLKVPIRK